MFAMAPFAVGAQVPERGPNSPGPRFPAPVSPDSRGFGPPRQSGRAQDLRRPSEQPRSRVDTLDALFKRLADADTAAESNAVAGSIGRIWARSGSETADLLLGRAALAASSGNYFLALELFDRIVALEPAWPEGFVGRANAKIIAGDAEGAARDFEVAVRLEPRRFDALGALGALQERAGAPKSALDAYRRALALDPRREEWRKAEERLSLEVEGRDI